MIIDTTSITPDEIQELRNLIFGPGAALDANGNLNIANLTVDKAIYGAKLGLTPITIDQLPEDHNGEFLVSDALSPHKGKEVVGGGQKATLVSYNQGQWQCL